MIGLTFSVMGSISIPVLWVQFPSQMGNLHNYSVIVLFLIELADDGLKLT